MKKCLWLMVPAALILAAVIYVNDYYRAVDVAMESEGARVYQTGYGWRFDGPSEDAALIFYPGAKVEATAYAPLMQKLAAAGLDTCLVKMPLRLAILDIGAADRVMAAHDYPHWFIGGHSLGGAMAAGYAAKCPDRLDGLVLLAAYPTKPLPDLLKVVTIYGSEDDVLNMKNLEKGRQYLPADAMEHVIHGGNHAGFGNYGPQKGDGVPRISSEQQQEETVRIIMEVING